MDRKWPIRPTAELDAEERRAFWEAAHDERDYQDVFSVTESAAVRDRVIRALEAGDEPMRRVLVPGCGSKTHLERALVERLDGVERVVATDFPGVVDLARSRSSHPRVQYVACDSTELGGLGRFDAVVNVNAVVSESDRENRAILASCFEALRPGGLLVGYFPTIFATVDAAFIDDPARLRYVDFERATSHYATHGQIYYTPLRLRQILREAGFVIERMEVFFLDDEHLRREARRCYDYDDPDLLDYEHFVRCRKPPAGGSR